MSARTVVGGLLAYPPSGVYLGIDPSLSGFAVTALAHDGEAFQSWVYKSPYRGVVRLDDIAKWLESKVHDLSTSGHHLMNIAIEDGVFHSQSAAVLGELSAAVRLYLYRAMHVAECRYPLRVPPTMAKKFATDRGNARKNEVMLAVYRKWDVEMADDNMADSFVLAHIARGRATTKYEQAVLDKLADPKFRDLPKV